MQTSAVLGFGGTCSNKWRKPKVETTENRNRFYMAMLVGGGRRRMKMKKSDLICFLSLWFGPLAFPVVYRDPFCVHSLADCLLINKRASVEQVPLSDKSTVHASFVSANFRPEPLRAL